MGIVPDRIPFAVLRAAHLRLGRRGERLAARLLHELGVEVLVRNYRCPAGEIDIVAREGEVLCFVEVKTRRRAVGSRPADAVGRAKRERLIRAAHHYLREIGRPALLYRFDIVELLLAGFRVGQARFWRQAFAEQEDSGVLRFPSPAGAIADAGQMEER
jgi:putative endonuclease